MDDNDIDKDKASQRANLIEQRMYEITLASIETMKHTTAVELHKSQNEMKRRLRKYRDRQREIIRNKPGFDKDPIEQLMARQTRNNSKSKGRTRPKTIHGIKSPKNRRCKSSSRSPRRSLTSNEISERKSPSSPNAVSDDSDSEIEIDQTFMIDQQKSKIDLRPKTAIDTARRGISWDSYVHNGRLGPPIRQVRYFDDDELKEREKIYKYLVDQRIDVEKQKLDTLDEKVAKFCEKETVQTMTKKMLQQRKTFANYVDWGKKNRQNVTEVVTKNLSSQGDRHNQTNRIRPCTSVGARPITRIVY